MEKEADSLIIKKEGKTETLSSSTVVGENERVGPAF